MPAAVADQVTAAMGQVVQYGTGRAARQPFPVYGKTGTTDDFTNAWFTGCSRAVCITVWMGYDRPYHRVGGRVVAHELHDAYGSPVYGGTVPAQIFARIFSNYRALQGPPGMVGASPYPTASAVTAHPTSAPTAAVTPTRRRPSPPPPPPSPVASETPSSTPSPTTRPLL
jgi:membrane peptidoglycan carboxypeptidase